MPKGTVSGGCGVVVHGYYMQIAAAGVFQNTTQGGVASVFDGSGAMLGEQDLCG